MKNDLINFIKKKFFFLNKKTPYMLVDYSNSYNETIISSYDLEPVRKNPYFIFFYIALISKLVKLSDKISYEKKQFIVNEIKKFGFNEEILNQVLDLAIEDKNEVSFYVNKIKNLSIASKNFYYLIIRSLILIASADNGVSIPEMKLLKKIAAYFSISEKIFGEIFFQTLKPNDIKDPYECLGVSKSDSKVILNKTFRQLAKKYHPDNFVQYNDLCEEYKLIMRYKFDIYTKAYNKIK